MFTTPSNLRIIWFVWIGGKCDIDQSQDHHFFLEENHYFDDTWNENQIQFLQKYFTNKPVCVYFGEGLVGKVLTHQLKPSALYAVYYDKWF